MNRNLSYALRRARAVAAFAVLPLLAGPAAAGTESDTTSGRYNTHCVRAAGSISCVEQWGKSGGFPQIVKLPARDSEAGFLQRDRQWLDRCQPATWTDPYGVRRFHYAKAGCEFGQYED